MFAATEQFVDGHAQQFAVEIPQGGLDGADDGRAHSDPTPELAAGRQSTGQFGHIEPLGAGLPADRPAESARSSR